MEQYPEAESVLRRACELEEANASAWHNLGLARDYQGQHEEAIRHYDRAIALAPDFPLPYFDKAVTLSFLDKKISALTHFKRALELDSGNFEAHIYMGDILREQGKRDEARRHYEEALKLDPGNERAEAGMKQL
jgi:superkiller protein 3